MWHKLFFQKSSLYENLVPQMYFVCPLGKEKMESISSSLEHENPRANEGLNENTEDNDEHFCIKCKSTLIGLQAYIAHRRAGCDKVQEQVIT